jgi:hypothetical protein
MFSITNFIFGPDSSLTEGGNTRALIRDPETGLVTGREQVKTFKGRPAFAEKINLSSGHVKREELRRSVIEALKSLDNHFKREHGHPLWDARTRDDILGSGFAFNGSSAHLFAPRERMPDEEFIKYKPTVGDIDLTVPEERMDELFTTLAHLEDQPLNDRITFIGHNKKSPGSDQINALFTYTWDPVAPEGEGDIFFQIDFEGSEYEGGKPSEWARFSHSSSWRDIKAGIKGLAHKILLFSIASVRSPPPINARLATPTATAENPGVSMTKDPRFVQPTDAEIEDRVEVEAQRIVAEFPRKKPDVARKEALAQVKREIRAASMRPARLRSMASVDLVTGLGSRYKKLDWDYNGDEVYKYLTRTERSGSTRVLKEIFKSLFGGDSGPSEKDTENFQSFLGLLDLMRERFSPPEIVKVHEEMMTRLYGQRAQKISATDPQEDRSVKEAIEDTLKNALPEVESSTMDTEAMKRDFYSRYTVRGQEGFVEDSDKPEIDESTRRHINRLIKVILG